MKTSSTSQKSRYPANKVNKETLEPTYFFPDLKIGVIIPAYNEELNIRKTLKLIPNNISDRMEVIVVDDGSVDNTSKVASCYNVKIIKHPLNKGYGAATKTGLNYCKNNNHEIAVILDADGQHDPRYISDFIRIILQDNIDFVIGNRFKYYYNMGYKRRFCSKLMTVFYFFLLRKRISDPTNGYRALSCRLYNDIEFESDYSLSQEMLFKIIPNYNYKEIPIIVKQREHGKSFIKIKNYFNKIILLFLKFYIFPKIKRMTHK
ncbi:MAG: glycosyltransferase family 2 protein, partial [Candidatus Odinarchaeota archaeon]